MAFSWERLRDPALLIWRAGMGALFVAHGLPKLLGGPERWEKLGGAMKYLGIDLYPQVWGLCAALAEGVGGVLLIVGLLCRPAAASLLFTMIVASTMHLRSGDSLLEASHAMEDGFSFLALLVLGPGRWSLDARWRGVN
jgi:putative oxidoreductase